MRSAVRLPPFLRLQSWKNFNYTLRSNDVRLDFEVRSSNPPAPMLQATGLFKERIARNEMEGGHTERNVKLETDLTEPQGTLKI